MTPSTAWLSATSAARLLHCPASASFISAPDPVPLSSPRNGGTLAHLAVNAWIESGAWLLDEPGRALQGSWDIEAARWGVDARGLSDSVMTRSRLRSRAAELRALLQSVGGSPRSDVFLRDSAQLLYGQADIVVYSENGGAVIDLKTGADAKRRAGGRNRSFTPTCSVRRQTIFLARLLPLACGTAPCISTTPSGTSTDCWNRYRRRESSPQLPFPTRRDVGSADADCDASLTGKPSRRGKTPTA